MTTQTRFFNDECHSNAHKLAAAVSALENATIELTAARKAHAEMECMGGRAEIVASHKAVSECELVASALSKQRNTLAQILAASLCENFYSADRAASAADRERRAAGMSAAMPHITAAFEAVQRARESFVQAAGGSDLISAMALNSERKSLIADLSADEVRPVPSPHLIGSRHLCPPELGAVEKSLSALLP